MCGLLGFLTTDGTSDDAVAKVGSAMHCLRHRGPDEHGTWHDADLVFGFNRLSIIDIAHSHQPLRWGPPEQPDRYALTFNGEIYNYLELRKELTETFGTSFATEGDSEAIVAAYHHWGVRAVQRLRGMFAFAIWTRTAANCSSLATRSASSRCSSRPAPAVRPSAARRRACSSSPT